MKKYYLIFFIFVTIIKSFFFIPAYGVLIKDITNILGVRENILVGYGLVVGLDGTGDQINQTPFTVQSLHNMLSQLGVNIPIESNIQLKNIASVMVTANLPAFSYIGQKIDVVVSSLGNARSLRGGTLLITPLKGVDNQIYALAQGNILITGSGIGKDYNKIQKNQLNGGIIIEGAVVEKTVDNYFIKNNTVKLQLNNEDFNTAQKISETINEKLGSNISSPINSRTINVNIPGEEENQIEFLSKLQNIYIDDIQPKKAIIVINSRTGSVVLNEHVKVNNCAIAYGDLSVEIKKNYIIDHKENVFGDSNDIIKPDISMKIDNQGSNLKKINKSINLNEVILALNDIGATPNDLMNILQSMQSAGCLNAQIKID